MIQDVSTSPEKGFIVDRWETLYHLHSKITGQKLVFGNYKKSCNALHDEKKYSQIIVFQVIGFGQNLPCDKTFVSCHVMGYTSGKIVLEIYVVKSLARMVSWIPCL